VVTATAAAAAGENTIVTVLSDGERSGPDDSNCFSGGGEKDCGRDMDVNVSMHG
jgi:hypothetical protein